MDEPPSKRFRAIFARGAAGEVGYRVIFILVCIILTQYAS